MKKVFTSKFRNSGNNIIHCFENEKESLCGIINRIDIDLFSEQGKSFNVNIKDHHSGKQKFTRWLHGEFCEKCMKKLE